MEEKAICLKDYKRKISINSTPNSSRKRKVPKGNTDHDSASKRRRPGTQSILFPANECVICGKSEKWVKKRKKDVAKRDEMVKCCTQTAEDSLKEAAHVRNDENVLRRIRGEDLIAKEAHYHRECRRLYTKDLPDPNKEMKKCKFGASPQRGI